MNPDTTPPFEVFDHAPYVLDIELLDETGIRIRVPGIPNPISRYTGLHPSASGSFLELRALARQAFQEAALLALSVGPTPGALRWDANTGPYRIAVEPPFDGISHVYLLVPGTSSSGHPSLVPVSGDAEQDAETIARWAVTRLVPRKSTGLLRALAAAAGCEDPDEPFRSSTLVSVGLPLWIRPATRTPVPESPPCPAEAVARALAEGFMARGMYEGFTPPPTRADSP